MLQDIIVFRACFVAIWLQMDIPVFKRTSENKYGLFLFAVIHRFFNVDPENII